MKKPVPSNIDWSRLVLASIAVRNLKVRCRHGLVRVRVATVSELTQYTLTRNPKISGRKARRIRLGFFEVYDVGKGWIRLPNDCHVWLDP